MTHKPLRTCERCGKQHLGAFVWLELNKSTGRYHLPGTVLAVDSQGLFPFGRTCARRELDRPSEHGGQPKKKA